MEKTQWIDAFQNIKKQLLSFVSIVVIAMLAVITYLAITYVVKALNVDIKWLMGYEEQPDAKNLTKKEELMERIKNISEEQAKVFLALLDSFKI